jgi:CheY-like chemotaxis protein
LSPPLVLIVEDDAAQRRGVAELLKVRRYRVQEAEDGIEALRWLLEGNRPHLILLDLGMPEMNGWQFCKEVRGRQAFAAIPIIVVSAIGDPGPPGGVQGFLPKPVDPQLLARVVAEHLQAE